MTASKTNNRIRAAAAQFPLQQLDVKTVWPFRTRRIKVATDGEIIWRQLSLTFYVSPQPLHLI